MKPKMKLLPFRVEGHISAANESQAYVPYGVELVHAPAIWAQGETGKGVVVAVLDTGIDVNHPDLKDNIIGGRNFTDEGDQDHFIDGNGHGTHCAGIIAANGAIKGVAPDASLLIGRVLDSNGSGDYQSIIDGIRWAAEWSGPNGERVRIISMSLGGPENDPDMEAAILEAVAKGIIVVVASGNEGDGDVETEEYGWPALINECVTVAACDEDMHIAPFSNEHKQVDVIAPGVSVISTYPLSHYARLSGTSMATPHVAGVCALLINLGERKFRRELTESEIFAELARVCCSLGYKASTEGNGLPQLTRFFEDC